MMGIEVWRGEREDAQRRGVRNDFVPKMMVQYTLFMTSMIDMHFIPLIPTLSPPPLLSLTCCQITCWLFNECWISWICD